jgi:hypothetical protein
MCWKLLILPQMHVLGEIYMFPHPSWLGLFATKCAFLHLENCVCRKYSFKKLTEFSQRNQVLHAAANNTAGFFFFLEIQELRSLSWIGLSGTNDPYSNLKSDLQKVCLSKLTQFSQGNKWLVALASTTDPFLLRDTCVSSTQHMMRICNKKNLSPNSKSDLQEVLHSKTASISTRKQWARYSFFYYTQVSLER